MTRRRLKALLGTATVLAAIITTLGGLAEAGLSLFDSTDPRVVVLPPPASAPAVEMQTIEQTLEINVRTPLSSERPVSQTPKASTQEGGTTVTSSGNGDGTTTVAIGDGNMGDVIINVPSPALSPSPLAAPVEVEVEVICQGSAPKVFDWRAVNFYQERFDDIEREFVARQEPHLESALGDMRVLHERNLNAIKCGDFVGSRRNVDSVNDVIKRKLGPGPVPLYNTAPKTTCFELISTDNGSFNNCMRQFGH